MISNKIYLWSARLLQATALTIAFAWQLAAADSISLSASTFYSTDTTPSVSGSFNGYGSAEGALIQILSGGIPIASSFDSSPSSSFKTFSFLNFGPGGMVLGATYTIRITIYDSNDTSGAIQGSTDFANALVLDGTQPVLQSIVTTGSNPANAGSVTFLATFSETVYNVNSTDFTVTGSAQAGTNINVLGSGNTRSITVSNITNSGSIGLAPAGGISINDSAGNSLATPVNPSPSQAYTIDATMPVLQSIVRTNNSPTNASSVFFVANFSEPVQNVGTGDFIVSGSASGGTSLSVGGGNNAWTITVNNITNNGALNLAAVASPTIQDLVGNSIFTPVNPSLVQTYTIDKTAPTISSIAPIDTNPTSATDVRYLVTFNETVENVATSEFSVTSSANSIVTGDIDISGASFSVSSATGTSIIVTVSGLVIVDAGTLTLAVDSGTITDLAGNTLTIGGAIPATLLNYSMVPSNLPQLSFPYADNLNVMFEDYPADPTPTPVDIPETWDNSKAGFKALIPTQNASGTAVPYIQVPTTDASPWYPLLPVFPSGGYVAYTSFTPTTTPAYSNRPPRIVRARSPFRSTLLADPVNANFTEVNQTGFIDFELAVVGTDTVAPLTIADDELDSIYLHAGWAPFHDPNLAIVGSTIQLSGSTIGTFAYGADSQHLRVTMKSLATPIQLLTVAHIIRCAGAELGGRNPSPAQRELRVNVTTPDGRQSNTLKATLQPYLFDDAPTNPSSPVSDTTVTGLPDIPIESSVNISDLDSAFTFAELIAPTHGTLTLSATTGAFSYLPASGYTGPDTFQIRVTDLGPAGPAPVWYGDARKSSVDVTYTVNIVDPSPADTPAIISNPPFEVDAEGELSYTLEIIDPANFNAATVEIFFSGISPATFSDSDHRPVLTNGGLSPSLYWKNVPASASGYYDFGLIVLFTNGLNIRAAYQPVLLKVRDISGGG